LENARLDLACVPSCGVGKKRDILLAFLFVAFLGGLVWMLSRPTEPVCHGKPLSAWLKELYGWTGDTNQAAFVAFREMGTKASAAVPMLLEALSDNDQEVRTHAAWALKRIDPAAAAKAGLK